MIVPRRATGCFHQRNRAIKPLAGREVGHSLHGQACRVCPLAPVFPPRTPVVDAPPRLLLLAGHPDRFDSAEGKRYIALRDAFPFH